MSKTKHNTEKQTAYAIGQTVSVSNAATNDRPETGTIERIAKGWFNVRLADGRIVSAREGSLKPALASVEDCSPESIEDLQPAPEAAELDEQPEEPKERHPMAVALENARKHYVKAKRPDGSATAHNGDPIARFLSDFEPLEVAELADRVLNVPAGHHGLRYGSLNPGQIRMNSGNRIRGYWSKILSDGNADEITRVGRLLAVLDLDETAESAGLLPKEVEQQAA